MRRFIQGLMLKRTYLGAVGIIAVAIAGLVPNSAFAASSWTIVGSPNPPSTINVLNAVSCTSASFCMAVGYYANDPNYLTLIEEWGRTWRTRWLVARRGRNRRPSGRELQQYQLLHGRRYNRRGR